MAKKSNVTPIADGRIQPQLLSVAFKHAKETANAHRFEELDDSGKPVTDRKAARFNYGVVYFTKAEIGETPPAKIEIVVVPR